MHPARRLVAQRHRQRPHRRHVHLVEQVQVGWQAPAAPTLTTTSPGPGSGSAISINSGSVLNPTIRNARIRRLHRVLPARAGNAACFVRAVPQPGDRAGRVGPDGRVIGRLVDLTADLVEDSGPHLVDRVVVKRGAALLLLPWETVANVGRDQLVLGVDAAGTERYVVDDLAEALADQEILLVRDVLDTQIVDVVGQRLARVADVVLTPTADGHLELIGVEVGFGGVLRRLHLPRCCRPARTWWCGRICI